MIGDFIKTADRRVLAAVSFVAGALAGGILGSIAG